MKRHHAVGRFVRMREIGLAAYLARAARRIGSEPMRVVRSRREITRARLTREDGFDGLVPNGPARDRTVAELRRRLRLWASPASAQTLRSVLGETDVAALVAEADAVIDGAVRVLGMPTVRMDRDAARWFRDPYSGHVWPSSGYGPSIRPSPYPGGPDIIVPWELSRGHGTVRLAQAYVLTGQERYARACLDDITDWLDSNPMPLGVNWASTMEAAIRSLNWMTALALIVDAEALDDEALMLVAYGLWEHGCFIERHLEGVPGSGKANNHLIACLAGMAGLGSVLEPLPRAQEWSSYADHALEIELGIQVRADGADFESALGYHALVFDLLSAWVLSARVRGLEAPSALRSVAGRMVSFQRACTAPDGLLPEVGDSDAGRLLRVRPWPVRPEGLRDFNDILGFYAAVLPDQVEVEQADPALAIWLLGVHPPLVQGSVADGPIAFPYAGIHVLRSRETFVLIDAGDVGQLGRGGHAHDDDLSYVFYRDGRPIVVDPGTGTYTGDYRMRAWMRSAAAHNAPTPVAWVGHRYEETSAFGMDPGIPPTIRFEGRVGEFLVVVGERWLHSNAGSRAVNERMFALSESEGTLVVRDVLRMERGRAPEIVTTRITVEGRVLLNAPASARIEGDGVDVVVDVHERPASLRVEEAVYSPSYGAIERRAAIVATWPWSEDWMSTVVFHAGENDVRPRVERLLSAVERTRRGE